MWVYGTGTWWFEGLEAGGLMREQTDRLYQLALTRKLQPNVQIHWGNGFKIIIVHICNLHKPYGLIIIYVSWMINEWFKPFFTISFWQHGFNLCRYSYVRAGCCNTVHTWLSKFPWRPFTWHISQKRSRNGANVKFMSMIKHSCSEMILQPVRLQTKQQTRQHKEH